MFCRVGFDNVPSRESSQMYSKEEETNKIDGYFTVCFHVSKQYILTGVVESLNNATGARVHDYVLLVVGVDNRHFGALEGHAKAETDIVLARLVCLMWNTITLDGKRQTSALKKKI